MLESAACKDTIHSYHSTLKPYVELKVKKLDSIFYVERKNDSLLLNERTNKKLWAKIKYDNLFVIKGDGFRFNIDPVFDFQGGAYFKALNHKYFNNTRGFLISGNIGKNFTFYTSYTENQTTFLSYVSNKISTLKIDNSYFIVPGEGLAKPFKTNSFDYANSAGRISYNAFKFLNFQFGNGKHFIGDGYRSLLLSDNSFNYPFFQATAEFWKIQYSVIYASFQDITTPRAYELGFKKKYSTIHFFSYNVTKKFNLGLFDATIWNTAPNRDIYKTEYLNPVIFYNPLKESSLRAKDNSLIGLNMKYKLNQKNLAYFQLAIDDYNFRAKYKGSYLNKYAYQLGIKSFDFFKVENLYFQTELNAARPYMYTTSTPTNDYSHYNQSLGSPLGANYYESVSFLNYRFADYLDKVIVEFKYNYIVYGADKNSNDNRGSNIFLSDNTAYRKYGNYITQGIKLNVIYKEFRVAYLINPKTNLKLEFSITDRTLIAKNQANQHFTFISFSLKVNVLNHYLDF